ncbi:MAG: HIT family hydrolase [Verrucomicrobia bacterium GWC2_42_7]|nr:MAG: HIT family hydrolase [Verrucomicrobia bacterium GWC2_42_7]
MQHLHAYWRMQYIESPKEKDNGKENPFRVLPFLEDREGLIIKRSQHSYVVMNRFPYNAGHVLIIPYREVSELEHLELDESCDFWNLIIETKMLLARVLKPDGFNIGFNLGSAAGAGIPMHLHCHVVPRWNGDTNFMPVIGDTKVLPQALDAMWERLTAAMINK